jgi:signal transduction histidine kinase
MRKSLFAFLFLALSGVLQAQSGAVPPSGVTQPSPSTIVFITSASDFMTNYQLLETFQTRWKEREPLALILSYPLLPYAFPLTPKANELSIAAIAERLKGKAPTLIVAQGDPAFFLALELRGTRFPATPLIAIDVVGNEERRKKFEDDKALWVVELSEIGEKNVRLATQLFPKRKRAVLLLHVGKDLHAADALNDKYVSKFPSLTVVTLPNPSQDSADAILRTASDDTFVIGLTPGWIDSSGRYRSGKDFVRSITETYEVPMFEYLRSHLDGGTVGGVGMSPTLWGRKAAEMGLSIIIDGGEPSHWVAGADLTSTFADYRELRRFGSSPKLLPNGAELINQPPPAWIRYQHHLQLLLALLVLVSGALIARARVKHREKKLLVAANARLESEVAARTGELRHANDELEATNTSLTEAIRRTEAMQENVLRSAREITLGRFTAGIANGINSPLNAARSASAALRSVALDDGGLAARLLAFDEGQRSLFLRYAPRILSNSDYVEDAVKPTSFEFNQRFADLFGEEVSSIATDLSEMGLSGLGDDELAAFADEKGRDVVQALYHLTVIDRSTWIIDEAVDRAAETIVAVREYMADGGAGTETRAVDLRSTIERALLIIKHRLPGSVILETDFEEVPPILGSEATFVRIWASLMQNAIQAMPHGGLLDVSLKRDGGFAVVSVGDEGEGVDPSIADKIFEPFVTTRSMAEGMGLGLAFCKRAIESAGGEIGFIRKENGTIFQVRVPLGDAT